MATKNTHEKEVPADHTPTPDEAREMFKENAGLSSVVTTEGRLHRDGLLTPE